MLSQGNRGNSKHKVHNERYNIFIFFFIFARSYRQFQCLNHIFKNNTMILNLKVIFLLLYCLKLF